MNTVMTRTHTVIDSPIGDVTLLADDGALVGVYLAQHRRRPPTSALGRRVESEFEDVVEQLGEYFAGTRTEFDVT